MEIKFDLLSDEKLVKMDGATSEVFALR
jgi:hypothetical protein